MRKLADYKDTIADLIANLDETDNDYVVRQDRYSVCCNVQLALRNNGYDISLQQAEQLWSDYSHNNYAGWMAGGENLETAEGAIADLCHDINFGENHIGL
ncbi:hypothetical protein BWH99_RS10085 [Vibrio parahaemolyticus]|nr:hypothetical protein [Vibrio parahaemolyticus]EIA9327379.1 hypothetical protein [Vibrio parahaemolyticus]EJG1681280.1 hypothetical protein [Vibrio parahaemolyticus]